jgi:hypothetical protein
MVTRKDLLLLPRQREQFAESTVLMPTDSIPFMLSDRDHTAFLWPLHFGVRSVGGLRRSLGVVH